MLDLFPRVALVALAAILVTLFHADSATAIDLEEAKERPCFKIPKVADIDNDWFSSVSEDMYYPLMSRLDLYINSLEVSGKKEDDLQESEIYNESCFQLEVLPLEMTITGFRGRDSIIRSESDYSLYKENPDIHVSRFIFNSGRSGLYYATLTDNATFVFSASCYDDNQMTWGVLSTKKVLPPKTIKLIHDHAESLGFDRDYFTGINYDNCKLPQIHGTIMDWNY